MLNAIFAAFFLTQSPAQFSEKIEAWVGDDIILTSDIESAAEILRLQDPSLTQEAALKLGREKEIEHRAMVRFSRNYGLSVSDADVNQEILSVRAAQGALDEASFAAMLKASGLTIEQFKNQVRRRAEVRQFYSVIQQRVPRKIEQRELVQAFEQNPARFGRQKEFDLSECVIAPRGGSAKAMQTAQFYLSNPSQFSECVKKESISASKSQGGALGAYRKGALRTDIEEKVSPLRAGDVVMIGTLGDGSIQLIRVNKVTDLGNLTLEQATPAIEEALRASAFQKEVEKVLAEVRGSDQVRISSTVPNNVPTRP